MNQKKTSLKRILFFLLIGFCAFAIIGTFTTVDFSQSNKISFVKPFQLAGKTTQSLSRGVSKMLPIDSFDEVEIGKNLKYHYATTYPADAKTLAYLQSLMKQLQKYKKKPFEYEVRLMNTNWPNAMAFPGGVIVVTTGLLGVLKSEAELVAVLSHEMGHVELNHCFDAVKYEILSKKLGLNSVGAVADFGRNLLLRHTFSKTQEDEADSYGFKMMTLSPYDPTAVAKAFESLRDKAGRTNSDAPNPLRDYFLSHPPIEQRVNRFKSEAQIWWHGNQGTFRYTGVENLKSLTDFSSTDFGDAEKVNKFKW